MRDANGVLRFGHFTLSLVVVAPYVQTGASRHGQEREQLTGRRRSHHQLLGIDQLGVTAKTWI
jgi:hypothetical protein